MFICPELIDETGRPPSANSWHVRVFLDWFGQVRVLEKNYTHLTEL